MLVGDGTLSETSEWLDFVDDCAFDVEVAVEDIVGVEMGVEVGPTVAASVNRLDEMLQQFFSPQHHLPFAQLLTGALSFFHFREDQCTEF